MRDIWRYVVLDIPPGGHEVLRGRTNETTTIFTTGEPIEARILVYRSGRRRTKDSCFQLTGSNWGFLLPLGYAIRQNIGWKDYNRLRYWRDPIWEDEEIEEARKQEFLRLARQQQLADLEADLEGRM